MIAQASGMNWGWDKAVAQGMHLNHWGHPDCITKIIGIYSPGHARAAFRLNTDDTQVWLCSADLIPDPGKELPAVV
ncbi:hypothetical protein ES703_113428 [subsurface metagenome]